MPFQKTFGFYTRISLCHETHEKMELESKDEEKFQSDFYLTHRGMPSMVSYLYIYTCKYLCVAVRMSMNG